MNNLKNYANILYWQYYSLLGVELAIALISDSLTCFAADVLDRAPLAENAPYSTVI